MLEQDKSWTDQLIQTAVSKIQSRAAKFLALKEPLYKQTFHPNPSVSNKAKELLAKQTELEGELNRGLALIEEIKTSFDFGKSMEVGNIALRIDNHMKLVDSFLGGVPAPIQLQQWWMPQTTTHWILSIAVVSIGVLIFSSVIFGKRKNVI